MLRDTQAGDRVNYTSTVLRSDVVSCVYEWWTALSSSACLILKLNSKFSDSFNSEPVLELYSLSDSRTAEIAPSPVGAPWLAPCELREPVFVSTGCG